MADRWASLAARAPVTVVFAALGLSAGTWAARIPAIKAELHLSPGILGLCLLGPAAGSVLTMPLAGAVMATVPPRRVVQCALLLLAGMLPLTTVVSSPAQLFAVLAGWGVGLGVVDVGMNLEGSAVQDRLGRRTMSGFHAAYSVGGLVGAGLGGIAAASGVSPRADFIAAGVVVLLAGGVGAQFFSAARPARPGAGESPERRPVSRWPMWSLALVCLAVPLVFTAAAQTGRAGPNLALVTMTGYVGVLAGPALVGGVAQVIGLHAALGIDVILCAMCAALAGFVRPRRRA